MVEHATLFNRMCIDFLRETESAGGPFDIICLDPPAFAKNRAALPQAKKGYKEINLRAMKLLKRDGILATSSCSYHLSEATFVELLADAAHDAVLSVDRLTDLERHGVSVSRRRRVRDRRRRSPRRCGR